MSAFTTISVYDDAFFDVSFSVQATAEGQPWNVESGTFLRLDTSTVQVPADAVDIELEIRGLSFPPDHWHAILKQTWSDTTTWPASGLSYETTGSVADMHCKLTSAQAS
jgi:hypothetical protein